MSTTLENNFISIKINDKGAELASLYKKENQTEYLWQADAKFWNRHAPVLFPIIGKLNNDKTIIKGKECKLGQHGLARDFVHTMIEKSPSHALFQLKSSDATLENYPYEFELSTEFILVKNSAQITYTVKNPSNENIYFSLGFHPAFNWPINPQDKKENYFIEFEHKETADRIWFDNGFITGENRPWLKNENKLNLFDDLFKDDVLIFKNLKSQKVMLRSKDHQKSVQVDFKDFPYLGIWTKAGNPFICIEPWFGIADNKNSPRPFVDKEGVQKLAPGNRFECMITYSIQ